GSRVEGAEAAVVGRADEHQPARGHRRAGAAGVADQALALRQLVDHAERDRPLDFPRARVDRDELAPRRLVARRLRPLRAALLVVLTRQRRAEREERTLAVDARAVVRLVGAVRVEAVAL